MAETELQQALRAGDLAQAGGLCQQALRSNPRDMQALYGLGLICLQSQQFAQAENVFARLVFFQCRSTGGRWLGIEPQQPLHSFGSPYQDGSRALRIGCAGRQILRSAPRAFSSRRRLRRRLVQVRLKASG